MQELQVFVRVVANNILTALINLSYQKNSKRCTVLK